MFLLTLLKIFAARIIDVPLGTVRTYFFVKGKIFLPFIIAFFEVLIWFIIAREALNIEGNKYIIGLFYAGGYATGTLIGSIISNNFIKGVVGVQVVVKENSDNLINELRNNGYGISIIELKNDFEGKNKDMLYIQTCKKNIKELNNIIKKYDEQAFLVVNETKLIQNGFVK